MNVRVSGADGLDLPDEVAAEVDDVRAQVAEGARARELLLQAPDQRRVVLRHDPFLQVHGAVVVDAPQLAALDQLVGLPHGGHEAVVEGGLVLDLRLLHRVQHLLRFFRRAGQGLLAEDVFAGPGGGDGGLGVGVVGPAVVEELDLLVVQHLLPVGVVLRRTRSASAPPATCFLVAPADGDELGDGHGRIHHVGQRLVRVRVGLAHEGVAQHAHADAGALRPWPAGRPWR